MLKAKATNDRGTFSLTVFGCDRDLLPVAVLKEGQCDVNESRSVAWSEDLCLRSTENNAVGKPNGFISRVRVRSIIPGAWSVKITPGSNEARERKA